VAFENAGEFRSAILAWAEDAVPKSLVMWQKRIVFEAFRKIIMRTPRDLGELVGGWVITIDWTPDTGTGEKIKKEEAYGKSATALANLAPFRIVWISNPVDHAWVIEEGKFEPPDPGPSKDKREGRKGKILVKGGYSTQSPKGMVGLTYRELQGKYAGMVLE
jgi:hypothetical protein